MDLQTEQLLHMMAQPVFYVKDGIVKWYNRAAANLVFEGQNVQTLFSEGGDLYGQWDRSGSMEAELAIFGLSYGAKVCSMDEGELFVLTQRGTDNREEGNTLLQTSTRLRGILQELITSTWTIQDHISDNDDLISESEILNRSLYRLLRLCNQLSDSGKLMHREAVSAFERIAVRDFLDRFVAETSALLEETGRTIDYTPCEKGLTCNFDRVLVERGIYHLLTYGIRRAQVGKPLGLRVWDDAYRLCFCVSYTPAGEEHDNFGAEGHWDLSSTSLGENAELRVVRLIAQYHGGSILKTTSTDGDLVRIIFSVGKNCSVHYLKSPMKEAEDSTGFHPGLVELSEILGKEMYHPDRV